MLVLVIEGEETYNEETKEFGSTHPTVVLELEHSLLSLSKWESKHQKPFLSSAKKTPEEIYDYLKFMVVTPGGDLDALDRCSQANLNEVQQYIDSSQSATTFGSMPERRGPAEVITAELIYFWLSNFNIPFEVELWHLNRLFALVKIANIKTNPKKMSAREAAQQNRELNERRRAEMGTSG